MWIVCLDIFLSSNEKSRLIVRTATSTVFSCPTKLISDVQEFREITAAMKT